MKLKHLFVFALPVLAFIVSSCSGNSSSQAGTSSESVVSSSSSSIEESTETTQESLSSEEESSSAESALPTYDPSQYSDCFIVHYHRDDSKYENWALWIWDYGNGKEGSEYLPVGVDDYGAVFAYPLKTWSPGSWSSLKLGIIVKSKGNWDKKDPDGDRIVTLSNLNMDEQGNYAVWTWTGVTSIYDHQVAVPTYISDITFLDLNTLRITAGIGSIRAFALYRDGVLAQEWGPYTEGKRNTFTVKLDESVDFRHEYSATATFDDESKTDLKISLDVLFQGEDFAKNYYYDGELGAIYSPAKTQFKVWSPFSEKVALRVYASGTPVALDAEKGDDSYDEYEMTLGEKGVWSAEVEGDLDGKYYTYLVNNRRYENKEIIDPYAKAAGINGVRGMVLDFAKTDPLGWDEFDKALPIDPKSLVVYETHVADITSHETWGGDQAKAKKYLGLIEEGTTYTPKDGTPVKTGFDHIKELGVNAIQLQPMFDHANDERPDKNAFNWGYNPLNYNVLEGSYSSDPYDGYARIREFKSVVKAYHEAGINVIMDVVYNHVSGVNGLNFDVLAPDYYFRLSNGSLSNGSGCGNETASERSMFHKFMVDSAEFLAKEYKLGGFRYDLMALHDLDTMEDIASTLHAYNPDFAVYGEPWAGGDTTLSAVKQASQENGNDYVGYAQFNDGMRDALVKSGMKGVTENGIAWCQFSSLIESDLKLVEGGLKGFTISKGTIRESTKTVNYVSCHDNYTIDDRIIAFDHKSAGEDVDEATRVKMNLFAQSFPLLSQGTSFMLAGEEMLRSKFEQTPEKLTVDQRLDYAHNSYETKMIGSVKVDGFDVNAIDYSRKVAFPDLFAAYKRLISYKVGLAGLHQDIHKREGDNNESLIQTGHDTKRTYLYEKFASEGEEYVAIFSSFAKAKDAEGNPYVPEYDFSGYDIVFDSQNMAVTDASPRAGTAATKLAKGQVILARKAA